MKKYNILDRLYIFFRVYLNQKVLSCGGRKVTEKEIEYQMDKALEKVPFEMVKIKIILKILKVTREIKRALRF